jgi:hypothetical protein
MNVFFERRVDREKSVIISDDEMRPVGKKITAAELSYTL